MRIIILTSSLYGTASICVPNIFKNPNIEIAMVVFCEAKPLNKRKYIKRKFKKILKIGFLGALNGIRMRPWFTKDVQRILKPERLDIFANRYGIRFEKTRAINCQRTIDLFTEANAQLGISLGNGYIGEKVFSIPRYGMINAHGEILPKFQGAPSIIWQIYEGSSYTGCTIHQVDDHFDTGCILHQDIFPIEFKPTLRETVSHNCARLTISAATNLPYVINNYSELIKYSKFQSRGESFTTPNFWEYLEIERQHRRLYLKYRGNTALP